MTTKTSDRPLCAALYPLDQDVEIPPCGQKGRLSLYPFRAMQVGDSFFAPTQSHSLRRNAYNHGRRYGAQYTTRFTTEGDVKGTRVWRIA